MRRTYVYAAMTEDVAQRSRWTFYEVVKDYSLKLFHIPKITKSQPHSFQPLTSIRACA